LGQNRFLEDEALYAYWGLQIATGADPMLDDEPVDKPPVHPYLLALSFIVFSSPRLVAQMAAAPGVEMPARLPSLFASVTSIALVYALGKELYSSARVGLLAALLLALSPFAILFASTAFTDPLLVAFVLGSLLAAVRGKLGISGVLIALAAATKQQGLFFLPLTVALGLLAPGARPDRRAWIRFVVGLAVVVAAVSWWDATRVQRPGFFVQSLISYGGLGLVPLDTWDQRAADWIQLLGYFWISPWLYGLLFAALSIWLFSTLTSRSRGWSRIDLVLAATIVLFLLAHWLLRFQAWDRYLLGLVSLLAILAARTLVAAGKALHSATWQRIYVPIVALILVIALAGPALQAAQSQLPLGGDHGAYDGIDDLATYLRASAPPGSVLYHFWLGHHYRFYLYAAPLRLHWYPDLQDLVDDATIYRREPRYIAFPSWRDGTAAEAALKEAGIALIPVLETGRRDGTTSFRLYRLEGP